MITTDTVTLDRTGLATVPEGTGKKAYSIGCYQKSDWEFIHEELKKDGSLEDNFLLQVSLSLMTNFIVILKDHTC